MRLDCAIICDAVTVREGLLNILGGGVTRLHRVSYPAPLGASLALRVMVHPTEARRSHELTLLLMDEDGAEVARMGISFQTDPQPGGDLRPGEELSLPIAAQVQGWPLPHEGAYSFEILIDGIHQQTVTFVADSLTALGKEEA